MRTKSRAVIAVPAEPVLQQKSHGMVVINGIGVFESMALQLHCAKDVKQRSKCLRLQSGWQAKEQHFTDEIMLILVVQSLANRPKNM